MKYLLYMQFTGMFVLWLLVIFVPCTLALIQLDIGL